ncbi:hypothetical protein L1987_19181 [Smallanthus sonchifolius]|uniref:Uncharacterized protein n=1 Tax=Smallanthus sonchifolius TaxID=185202 RepID=A0ACB9IP51_9ASTR|nr:hypothetical protein L1987_19181 [Smallanthus sonchifolius]
MVLKLRSWLEGGYDEGLDRSWGDMHMIIHYMRILLESRRFFINLSVMFGYLGRDGMRPQCHSLGIRGMGGTPCTHHTTFGKREGEVHSTVGGSFGEGLEDAYMQSLLGYVWEGSGTLLTLCPSFLKEFKVSCMGNRTLHREPMKRVAKAQNIKPIMNQAQGWRIQKHKIGFKFEKSVCRGHNWEHLPDNRQSLITLEDKREITKLYLLQSAIHLRSAASTPSPVSPSLAAIVTGWKRVIHQLQPCRLVDPTGGASKSTSHADGEDLESLVVPSVGLEETQEGLAASPQPPLLPPITDVCDTNKESSGIPSVSVMCTK